LVLLLFVELPEVLVPVAALGILMIGPFFVRVPLVPIAAPAVVIGPAVVIAVVMTLFGSPMVVAVLPWMGG
jgi:hypothetical protein